MCRAGGLAPVMGRGADRAGHDVQLGQRYGGADLGQIGGSRTAVIRPVGDDLGSEARLLDANLLLERLREGLVLLVELRRADSLQLLLHDLPERLVVERI